MAYGFKYKKNANANGGRTLVAYTLTDSTEYTEGDAMKLASGKLDLVGANTPVFGILESFTKTNGDPVTDNGAGATFVGTYTTPSSNTVKAIVDISIESIYSVICDATLGTTVGSDLAGYNMDVVAASDRLDESTSLTTTNQFFSHGKDNEVGAPTNSVLVSIQESQVKI